MIAFMFPGQGSQVPGMYRLLQPYEAEIQDVFDAASDASGKDVRQMCRSGSAQELLLTENTQVAVTAMSLAFCQILRGRGIVPDVVMGHSVGQYAAVVASGAMDLAGGFALVVQRAQLMGQVREEGALNAVSGLDYPAVQEVCRACCAVGLEVSVALYNSPTQIVVGGLKPHVEHAGRLFLDAGALRVTPLKVETAFHTPVMASMVPQFTSAVRQASVGGPRCAIILNCSGVATRRAADIVDDLIAQCCHAVLWAVGVKELLTRADKQPLWVAEVGVGKTLAGLMRSIDRSQGVFSVSEPRQMAQFLAAVRLGPVDGENRATGSSAPTSVP